MHRPARETLRLAVFDSERARVRSSRLLRASEREREPQEREREREREGVVSRYLSPKSVGNINTKTTVVVVLGVRKKKKEKKSQKRWTEGGEDFITYDAKRKRALLSMAIKISSFFFVSKEELDCGKKRVALLLVLVKIGWVISVERRHKKKLGVENYSIEQQTTTTTTSVPRRALEFESPWDRARAAASTRAHLLRRLARGRRSSSFFFRESKRERKKGKNDNLSGGVPL